jgi:hypothetical protein
MWPNGFDTHKTISKSITSAAATATAQTVPAIIQGAAKVWLYVSTFSTASSIDVKVAQTSTTSSHYTFVRTVSSGSTLTMQNFVLPHSVHGATYDVSDIAGAKYAMISAACSPTDGATVTWHYIR